MIAVIGPGTDADADVLAVAEQVGVDTCAGADDRDHCCRKQTSTSHLAKPSRS